MQRLAPRWSICVVIVGTALLASSTPAVETAAAARAICSTGSTALPLDNARLLAVGNYRGPLASHASQAQRFFDQGLVFGWGFNFAEAVRSFRAAAQIDPDCALCRWGVAWALGPSINHEMSPADVPVALDAIVQAQSRAAAGSRERALIDALAKRYAGTGVDPDQPARSYAAAMRALADRYVDDADIAVLAAEAMMNAHAYDYWRADGRPQAWTPHIIGWLERALALAPEHPGAHHYRIHLFEDSRQPEQALASADQLGTLAPIVGHLVHMPSHIYFRLGRYRQAVAANTAAVQSDRDYAAASGAVSDYSVHNLHFLWGSALWGGDRIAADAADQLAAAVAVAPSDASNDGTRQHFLAAPALTRVRLRQWDSIVPARVTVNREPYLQGLSHFASGMALAARGDVAAARAILDSLRRSAQATRSAGLTIKNIHRASRVLLVASLQLESAIASASDRPREAIRLARAAVAAEDRLASDDPPVWPLPSRHLLGAGLLQTGRAAEALSVYDADLKKYPHNCVAQAGVAAAGRMQRTSPSLKSPAQTSAPFSFCPE